MEELDALSELFGEAVGLLEGIGDVRVKDTCAGVYDAVTDADVRIEKLIVDGIRSRFPGDSIISEETS